MTTTPTKVQDLPSGGNAAVNDYFVGEHIAGTTVKLTYAPKLNMDPSPGLAANLTLNGFNVGAATATEIGYLSGVTSSVQTQINSKVTTGGALGTPSSGNLSNCTNYPLAQLTGAGAGVLTFLATPSSANLYSALTTKTGSGTAVFGTSPALTTPAITTRINDANGNGSIGISATASAVNYIQVVNSATSGYPEIQAAGSDTDTGLNIRLKGTGVFNVLSGHATIPIQLYSGTGNQHQTAFSFANTAAVRTVTFPDATGTVCFDTGSTNITTVGTVTAGTWNASVVGLTYGGTGANLTASNGGIIYSTSSAMAVLAGTATASKMLLSGSSAAPTWSTSTIPSSAGTAGKVLRSDGTNYASSTSTFADTYSASNLLYSNGANTVTGLATANNGVLVTNGSGVPSISSTLPTGLTIPQPLISGITSGSGVASGNVGQVSQSSFGSVASITTNTVTNITSITLAAGNWLLYAVANLQNSGAVTINAATFAAISTANNTVPQATSFATAAAMGSPFSTSAVSQPMYANLGPLYVTISGSTTYYLNVFQSFSAGTVNGLGGITAVRVS